MKWTFSRRRSRRSSGRAWPRVTGSHSTDLSGTRRRPRCLNERDLREARKPPRGPCRPRRKTETSPRPRASDRRPNPRKPADPRWSPRSPRTGEIARRLRSRPILHARGGAEETAVAAPPRAPLKLTFRAIDGYGSSPALLSGEPRDLPVDERGREYILLLDSQGIVRRVTPQPNGRDSSISASTGIRTASSRNSSASRRVKFVTLRTTRSPESRS